MFCLRGIFRKHCQIEGHLVVAMIAQRAALFVFESVCECVCLLLIVHEVLDLRGYFFRCLANLEHGHRACFRVCTFSIVYAYGYVSLATNEVITESI